ncbi:MAG: hypothetical protein PHE97_03615 [Candidatus Omnitrophica bacterium]|nr:hypothetical protein [Candidatus Omnitrophota bacterium]
MQQFLVVQILIPREIPRALGLSLKRYEEGLSFWIALYCILLDK